MSIRLKKFCPRALTTAVLLWVGAVEVLASRNIALPSFLGRPSEVVSIPVNVNDASLLAAIGLKVNYDPQTLEFVAVRNDGLGAAFELTHSVDDGVVTLMLNRSTSLLSGSGRFVVLDFLVNPGAKPGTVVNLPIAGCELSDDTGVLNLNLGENVVTTAGRITVTNGAVDNDVDHIPDDWEVANGLSPLDGNDGQDLDGDGIPDLAEYALGLNPRLSDSAGLPVSSRATVAGADYLALDFNRRRNPGVPIQYQVEESDDLIHWSLLDFGVNMMDTPVDLGNGFERVRVRGNIPMAGQSAQPKGYLRLQIQP